MVTYPLERRILAELFGTPQMMRNILHLHKIFLNISVIKPLLSSPESKVNPLPKLEMETIDRVGPTKG